MTINEAYEFVMNKLERLKNEGIDYTMNESIKTPVLIEKYDKPNRLPVDKWINIAFNLENESDVKKIHDMENLCKMVGIYFDTRFGKVQRDWEIDWSFRLNS
jgi:hypothetical protein